MWQWFDKLRSLYRLLQVYDSSLGIDFRETEVVLVQTRLLWQRFKVLKTISLPITKPEEIGNILSQAIDSHGLKSNYTVINFPRRGTLLKMITIPMMAFESIQSYLVQNNRLFLPTGLEAENMQINFRVLKVDEQNLSLLILASRRNVIQQHIFNANVEQQFQTLYKGFYVENLLSGEQAEGAMLIITIDEFEIFAVIYQNNELIDYQMFETSELTSARQTGSSFDTFLEKLQLPNSPKFEKVKYLVCGSEKLCHPVKNYLNRRGVEPVKLDHVSPLFLEAFALSVNPFITQNDDFDLNSAPAKYNAANHFYKQLTFKSIFLLGMLTLTVSILLYTIQIAINWKTSRHETHFNAVLPLLNSRDSLLTASQSLRNSWKNYSSLIQEKTHFAYYLYRITLALPSKAWLYKIRIEENENGFHTIQLSGLTEKEAWIAQFLENLEEMPFSKNIVLDEMKRYSGKAIYQKWKVKNKQIIEFKVQFDV